MKTCYIKCVSNQQAQQLRPELVKVGFVDRVKWNDKVKGYKSDCSYVMLDDVDPLDIGIHNHNGCERLLYTLTPDENLTEAAVKIKTLFDNQ